jgi:hypothetical protein
VPGNKAPECRLIKHVATFQELVATPFTGGVNALCLPRNLAGDFGEVVRAFDAREDITVLDEKMLLGKELSAKGKEAMSIILEDMRVLRELGRDPVLNLISGYPRDEADGPVATDVFSFHADSAPIEADTWLCTYHGSPSEGLRNEDAIRKVDVPEIQAALLAEFRTAMSSEVLAVPPEALAKGGGGDDDEFRTWLNENCYDLHYAAKPGAKPWSFGIGNLWRITVDWPGSPVPPCVHRAPETEPGKPRLLLIC